MIDRVCAWTFAVSLLIEYKESHELTKSKRLSQYLVTIIHRYIRYVYYKNIFVIFFAFQRLVIVSESVLFTRLCIELKYCKIDLLTFHLLTSELGFAYMFHHCIVLNLSQ